MRKVFKIVDLECAHCAQKMEDSIRKLEGVEKVTVSFLTQKLTLQAVDERFDEIAAEAAKICKKIEPDCRVIL